MALPTTLINAARVGKKAASVAKAAKKAKKPVQQKPLQRTEIGLGLEQMANNEIALVGGQRSGSSKGDETRAKYAIYDMAAINKNNDMANANKYVLGDVELFVEDGTGRVRGLVELNVKDKKKGVGRKVVDSLMQSDFVNDLNIHTIKPSAQGFWDKMGAESVGNQLSVIRKQPLASAVKPAKKPKAKKKREKVEPKVNLLEKEQRGPVTLRGTSRTPPYPDIYGDPRALAAEAASRTAPETGAMKQLFGVGREDLYNMAQERGLGNPSVVQPPARARGSAAAQPIMGKANTQRLIDILAEGEKYPALKQGMDAWYEMGPVHNRLVSLLGQDEGNAAFNRLNTLSGIMSSQSDVVTEMRRGTAANWLNNQGLIDDFIKYGGTPADERTASFPAHLKDVPGHVGHKTSQGVPLKRFVETGEHGMGSPKVPVYIQASTPEELGGSWRTPVGDAHWSRAVGLADTRNTLTRGGEPVIPDASVSTPELNTLTPWWAKISDEVGIKPVPAQARLWGLASGATGVDSPIGASKLEILSNMIMQRAKELGVDPESFRDYVLTGGKIAGGTGGILTSMGAFAEEGEK